jgi:hypothetical protein
VSRPVIYRTLHARWVPLQLADWRLRSAANSLRTTADDDCGCDDCQSSCDAHEEAAEALRICADHLRSRWLPREEELADDDRFLLEAMFAFEFGKAASLDEELPEAGVRVCGPGLTVYMRFADSTSTEEPELLMVEDLLAQ